MDSTTTPATWRYTLGFLLVGLSWGLTTPFMRAAALSHSSTPSTTNSTTTSSSPLSRLSSTLLTYLSRPAYTIPLLLNVTGSIWFFLLIGQAELSLTVPITNSLAFLFTVLGEWWAEGKVIQRETWVGMVLVLAGIGLCVYSKS